MDIEMLARNVHIHQIIAESFEQRLIKLWQRALSNDEKRIARSCTLCTSFMHLESIEAGLIHATTVEQADHQFSRMAYLVSEYAAVVEQSICKAVSSKTRWTNPSEFSDLLSWEQAILDDLRR